MDQSKFMKWLISQSIKLASQRRIRDRKGKDSNNFYKSKKISWPFEVKKKRKMLFWLEKDISRVENILFQWILQNILENWTFQAIPKFIMPDFHKMDVMRGIVIFVKVDEMYNILKSASNRWLNERWDGNEWSNSFCWWYAHMFTTSLLY